MLPEAKIAIIGSEDLFDAPALVAKPGQPLAQVAGAFKFDMADLKPGDLVVHAVHGVGRFLGVRELGQGEQRGDFMLIEYAHEAKLYVPLTRLDLIEKHRGAGRAATRRSIAWAGRPGQRRRAASRRRCATWRMS